MVLLEKTGQANGVPYRNPGGAWKTEEDLGHTSPLALASVGGAGLATVGTLGGLRMIQKRRAQARAKAKLKPVAAGAKKPGMLRSLLGAARRHPLAALALGAGSVYGGRQAGLF